MLRQQGRSEDSTVENTVIVVQVKLKKSEEMSRRIDLHTWTIDCKFCPPRSLLTFSRALVTGGKRHQNVLTLQLRLYHRKIGSPVTRKKPSEKNLSSRVLMFSNVRDRQLVPSRIYLKWYTTYFYYFVPIKYRGPLRTDSSL